MFIVWEKMVICQGPWVLQSHKKEIKTLKDIYDGKNNPNNSLPLLLIIVFYEKTIP